MPRTKDRIAADLFSVDGKDYPIRKEANNVRSRLGKAVLLLCTLFAAFCFYQHATVDDIRSLPIEKLHPADKVIVDAPKEAISTDFARLTNRQINWNANDGSLEVKDATDPLRQLTDASAEAITKADYRLIILQAKQAWDDGTYNEVNVETLQPWQWIHENEVHVGGYAPLPLDTLEMGLPEGMTGKVIDILPCPKIKFGRGRVVLTTINRLARGVIELTLRDSHDREETLRPTGEHLFYSVTQGEWLAAEELQPGEHLDGLNGTVTVTATSTLPGTHRVYNLSVQGEHLYRVANCGVLVHNNYAQRWQNKTKLNGEPYAKPGPKTDVNAPHNAAIRGIVEQQKAKGLTHIGGGDLTELLIATPGGVKPFRRADASFRDPVTGEVLHFNVGRKNLRGDPIIREREALLDIIQRGDPANRRIKFREYSP